MSSNNNISNNGDKSSSGKSETKPQEKTTASAAAHKPFVADHMCIQINLLRVQEIKLQQIIWQTSFKYCYWWYYSKCS
jgi:hypothetical protein